MKGVMFRKRIRNVTWGLNPCKKNSKKKNDHGRSTILRTQCKSYTSAYDRSEEL